MTRRYALRDDQWERIKDLLPGRAFPLLSHCRRTIGSSWKLNKPFARQSHAAVSDKHPHCKFCVSLLAMQWAM
jgi:hypothetical protein